MTVSAPGERLAAAWDVEPNTASGRRDELLLRRFAQSRDPVLREQVVRRYLPLARHAAKHYARSSEPFEDLLQVACVGLLKAIERYDPQRGAAFSSYAIPTMLGELRRHFRDRGWAVRPPRHLQEHALTIERATEELRCRLGRSPTLTELAEHCDLDEETVLDAREAAFARTSTSLSTSHDGDATALEDRLQVDEPGFRTAEHRATLNSLSRTLTARERRIVYLRFNHDMTQAEIGELIGCSQMHVSRLLRTAMDKLRLAAGSPHG